MASQAYGIEQVKRTANSRTVLSYVAAGFLLLFGYFWYSAWSLILGTQQLLSPVGAITVVLTLCYTVVWPLFGSMMIPNSPARHFLQKQTWAVPGSVAVVCATTVLGYFALRVFYYWVAAQAIDRPESVLAQDSGVFWSAVFGIFVGAFFVPVLCWATATPEQIIAQIQQALWIKDMERAAQLRKRAWAAADVRAQAITHAARLTGVLSVAQGRELAGLMLASHRTLQYGLRMVALTMDDQVRMEDLIPSTPDPELVKLYREVPLQLAAADEALDTAVAQIDERSAIVQAPDQPPAHVHARPQSSIPRAEPCVAGDDTRRHATSHDDAYALAAWKHFGVRPWTIKKLAEMLDVGETKTKELRDAWIEQGLVANANLGRWHFTEREEG